MSNSTILLIALGLVNLALWLSNRYANFTNYKKLTEILTEEKKQSAEKNEE